MLKKYSILALVIVLSIAFTNSSDGASKKVLLEGRTGSWCPPCPGGALLIQEFYDEYGDNFIGVQLHTRQDDPMNIPESGELGGAYSIGGIPGGVVNRKNWSAGVGINTWTNNVASEIGSYTPLEVDVEYSINGNNLEATVTVTADADYNEQFAVNLIVVEDGFRHTQANAFNGQQGHPYYQKGNPMLDYEHMNVAWKYLGGTWGDAGDTPMSMTQGETYQKTFTWNLAEESRIRDYDNIWVVGFVQELNRGEVINSEMAGKEGVVSLSPFNATVSAIDNIYKTVDATTPTTETITVSNDNDRAMSFSISTESSIIPQNWNLTLSQTQGTLQPGEEAAIEVSLNANGNGGYAAIDIEVEVTNQLGANEFTSPVNSSFNALSNATKSLYLYGYNQAPNTPLITLNQGGASSFFDGLASIVGTDEVLTNYDLSFVETAIIEVSDQTSGPRSTAQGDALRDEIRAMIDNGVDIMFSGALNVYFTLNSQFSGQSSQNAKDFYRNTLGIELGSPAEILNLLNNNQLSQPPISGMNDLNGLAATLNGLFNSQQYPIFDQAVDIIKPVAGREVTNLAYIPGLSSGGNPLAPEQSLVMVGIEIGDSRIAFSTFSWEALGNQPQNAAMIGATYDWIKGASANVDKPEILVAAAYDFGPVSEETIGEIFVENVGDANLVITDAMIQSDSKSQFEFDESSLQGATIAPGGTHVLRVRYLATEEGNSYAELAITSEDGENDAIVALSALLAAAGPQISVAETHDFGVQDAETFALIPVQNIGGEDLIITGVSIQNDANSQFEFVEETLPITLLPNESISLEVNYLATVDGVSTADMVITTEGGENDATVSLSAEKLANSISNQIDGVFSMEAQPNVFDSQSNLNINVVGTENVNITMADAAGNTVATLHNGMISGSDVIEISASGLTAGKYFIVANIDGKLARVSVIINK